MIVPMKKATIIVQEKDAKDTVADLRRLGVLHIEHQNPPQAKDISVLQEEVALINSAVFVLEQAGLEQAQAKQGQISLDVKAAARHLLDRAKHYEQLESYSRSIQAQINEWLSWGDFDPREIQQLEQKGIYAKLFQIPLKQLHSAFPQEAVVKNIFTTDGIAHCIVISQKPIECAFKELPLPKQSLSSLKKRLSDDQAAMTQIKNEILKQAAIYPSLLEEKNKLGKEIEFQQAIFGMAREGAISYLSGYIPFDKIELLCRRAREQQWGILIREPAEEDNVPVLLRNPRWLSLISPIFKFLEILPGYRELDISLPFLVFFSIFFGILIGDAGYGLMYFLITAFIQRKMRGKVKDNSAFSLFYLLSLCAVVWGVLTGTFFGQEWLLKAGYKPLVPALTQEKGLQRFCFFLGALHLSLAHCWRGIIKLPSLNALADLGSICLLWAVFFIAKMLILGDGLPAFVLWLVICGVGLVIIFTNPQKNIFKFAEEWLAWLITLPFSFIGNFADVVSYIRLFAVGLAGVAIADAFNAMAAMIGRGNVFLLVLAAVIALIGNTLGLVLGPVSVLVHGVRLNLLEFSGHMGLSWSGAAYKPLRE